MKKVLYSKTDSLPMSVELLKNFKYELRFGDDHRYIMDTLDIMEFYRILVEPTIKKEGKVVKSFKQGFILTSTTNASNDVITMTITNMMDFTKLLFVFDKDDIVNELSYMVYVTKLSKDSITTEDDYVTSYIVESAGNTYIVGFGKSSIEFIDTTSVFLSGNMTNMINVLNLALKTMECKNGQSLTIPAVIYGGPDADVLEFKKDNDCVCVYENGIEILKLTYDCIADIMIKINTVLVYTENLN